MNISLKPQFFFKDFWLCVSFTYYMFTYMYVYIKSDSILELVGSLIK